MAAKAITYTFEVACNVPTGIWRVADRTFVARRLTMSEKAKAQEQPGDLNFAAAALSILKIEGEDITPEWLAERLNEDEVILAALYSSGGTEAVERYLKSLEKVNGG